MTYCKLCNKDVILPNPIPEDNKDPNGYIVCKKCYWIKKSPEKRLSTKEILKSKFSTKKSSSEDTNEIKNVKTQRFWGISTDISSKTM
jgi:hypothetical protein